MMYEIRKGHTSPCELVGYSGPPGHERDAVHVLYAGTYTACSRALKERGERLIITDHAYPPIPVRGADWVAWYDDEGAEAGNYGYGATEAEAIQDLKDNNE